MTIRGKALDGQNGQAIRILIVDDHPVVRRGLAYLIESEEGLEICGEADDETTAIEQVLEKKPHLIVVDISLRASSGIELIKRVKLEHPEIRLLVSSMHEESVFAERSLRAGAQGYITKQEATDKIIEAIRSVMSGRVYLSAQMTDRMLARVIGSTEDTNRSPIENLSDREMQVFEFIAQGLKPREIATRLGLSHKTVETHRENIKKKFGLPSVSDLNRYAVQWMMEKR